MQSIFNSTMMLLAQSTIFLLSRNSECGLTFPVTVELTINHCEIYRLYFQDTYFLMFLIKVMLERSMDMITSIASII